MHSMKDTLLNICQVLVALFTLGLLVWYVLARKRLGRYKRFMGPGQRQKAGGHAVAGVLCLVVFGALLQLGFYMWKTDAETSATALLLTFGVFGLFYVMGVYYTISSIAQWRRAKAIAEIPERTASQSGGNAQEAPREEAQGENFYVPERSQPYGYHVWFGDKKPILATIKSSVEENGELPADFILPKARKGSFPHLPGSKDGYLLYNFSGLEGQEEAADTLLRLMEDACNSGVTQELEAFLFEQPIIFLADPLVKRLVSGQSRISFGQMFFSARKWVEGSPNADLVKLGTILFNVCNVEHDEECRDMLMTLALCDEFSLYVQVVVSKWYGANELVFEMAKRVHGWGKIHLVNRLEPDTAEIREWVVKNGCKNNILHSYLGLAAARKADIFEYLRRDAVEEDIFAGICVIMDALLDGSVPAASIRNFEGEVGELFILFLKHAAAMPAGMDTLWAVEKIVLWCAEQEEDWREVILVGEAVLNKLDCKARVEATLAEAARDLPNRKEDLILALRVAGARSYSFEEPLYELIKSDPLANHIYVPFLFSNHHWALKAIELYEETLPEKQIATGMGDEWGTGKGYEYHRCLSFILVGVEKIPLTGTALVETALSSPVVGNRNMACTVLEHWGSILGRPLEDFAPDFVSLLQDVSAREVNEELRKRYEALIGDA